MAGEAGPGSLGSTAVGEQVGMGERMESVASPGAVMLSESTARLVERAAVLGEQQVVHIKGANDPVSARCLFGMTTRHEPIGRKESPLVGRRWEMAAVEAILDRSTEGHGGVVAGGGPAGIGKARPVPATPAVAAAPRDPTVFALLQFPPPHVP